MIKAVTTVSVSFALLFGAVAPLFAQPSGSQIAADEAVKREAKVIQLRRVLEDAQASRKKGDLDGASRLFEEAYALVQQVGTGIDSEKGETVTSLVSLNMEIAEKAQRRGDLAEAGTRVKRALSVDPKNTDAQEFKKNNDKLIEQQRGRVPSSEVKSRLPEIREERMQTSTMVQDARLLVEMGRLDEAEAKLKDAIKRDPENKPAAYYLSLVKEIRFSQEARKREIVTKEGLVKIEQAWNTDIKRDRLPDANPYARTNLIYTGKGRQAIQHKLDTIVIDEVLYDGIPLNAVVTDLTEQARRRDPEKRGINFIINPYVDVPPPPTTTSAVDPVTGNPLPAPAPAEPLDLNNVAIRLHLRNVRLADVIDAISKVAEKPIKYSMEEYAIVFTQRTSEAQPLFTRVFKVNPNTFMQGLQSVSSR